MIYDVKPIKSHFAADIVCDDVKNLSVDDRSGLIDLLAKYKLLRFRKQTLTTQDFVTFSGLFGPVWRTDDTDYLGSNGGDDQASHEDSKQVVLVSNLPKGVLRDWQVRWHSDSSHKPWQSKGGTLPSRALYPEILPTDEITITRWFDQEWIYDHLPEEYKDLVHKLEVTNKAMYDGWGANTMPFVVENPITGKKSVMIQRLFFHHFENLPTEEGLALQDKLLEIGSQEENVFSNEWEYGDLILYTNFNTCHQREKINSKGERTVWRTTFQIPELIPHVLRPAEL